MHYPTKEMMITQQPKWKLAVLHYIAKVLGVLIKYEGWPLGSNRKIDFTQFRDSGGTSSAGSKPPIDRCNNITYKG